MPAPSPGSMFNRQGGSNLDRRQHPVERRAVAVSMWGAVGALAAAVGPGLGSILVDTLGWRWAFFINVPPAIWALIRARTQIPAERRTGRVANVDLIGVALLIVGMGALTAAVIAFGEHAASAQVGWLSAALGVVCILLFVFWANFQEEPALDLSLFANRTYSAVNLATLAFGIAFTMMFFGFFFFMTGIWKYSLPMAGVAVTPGPLLVIPVAMLSGRAAARVGHRPFLIGGSLLVAAGGVWQAIVPGVEPSYVLHWLPSQLVTGIGVGMALPSFSGAAVASLGPSRFGVGSAVNQALRQFGSVVGVALTVVIAGGNHFDLTRFQTLAQTYAGFAVLAALLCLPVKTRPGP
ncbi:MAG: MFS transporter [Burkholderiales bacterium]|nr:MAG: MFS transporter [Burkholderiales bacterium]